MLQKVVISPTNRLNEKNTMIVSLSEDSHNRTENQLKWELEGMAPRILVPRCPWPLQVGGGGALQGGDFLAQIQVDMHHNSRSHMTSRVKH